LGATRRQQEAHLQFSIREAQFQEERAVFDSGISFLRVHDAGRSHDPAAFANGKIGQNTAIANAFIVIDGEPMTEVSDEAIV
jgi:hypothetical protein